MERGNDLTKRRGGWRLVVLAADCDEDGNCPICGTDYADCPCPGPALEGFEYRKFYVPEWGDDLLYARRSRTV